MMKKIFLWLLSLFLMHPILPAEGVIDISSPEKIIALMNSSSSKPKKVLSALTLCYKNNFTLNEKEKNAIGRYLVNLICDKKKISKENQALIINLINKSSFKLSKRDLFRLEKIVYNPKRDIFRVNESFRLLYCNFYFTVEKGNRLFNFLVKLKPESASPAYIVLLSTFLVEDITYKVSGSFTKKLASINYYNRYDLLLNKLCRRGEIGYDSVQFMKLWIQSSEIFTAVLNKGYLYVWNNAEEYLYGNNSLERGKPFFEFMMCYLQEEGINDHSKYTLLKELSFLHGIAFFRNDIPLLIKLSSSQLPELAQTAKNIINNLTCGAFDEVHKISENISLLDHRLFNLLFSNKWKRNKLSQFDPYSLLLPMSMLYTLNMPENYKVVLQDIKIGNKPYNRRAMKIILMQDNIESNPVVLDFINNFFADRLVQDKALIKSFYQGLKIHWINIKEIRVIVLKRLNSEKVDISEKLLLINLLSYAKNAKKEIAENLLKLYSDLNNRVNEDSSASVKIHEKLQVALSRLTGESFKTDLKLWQKAISAMPNDK